MALVSALAGPRDVVAVLFGLEVPFPSRRHPDGVASDYGKGEEQETYESVGDCYVHGITDGEIVKGEKGMEIEFRITMIG